MLAHCPVCLGVSNLSFHLVTALLRVGPAELLLLCESVLHSYLFPLSSCLHGTIQKYFSLQLQQLCNNNVLMCFSHTLMSFKARPPFKVQPPNKGQHQWSQRVRFSEVPLYKNTTLFCMFKLHARLRVFFVP